MTQNQYLTTLKNISNLDLNKLSELTNNIIAVLDSQKNEDKKLCQSIYGITEQIMAMNNIKNNQRDCLDNLINQIIKICLTKQLKIGSQSLKLIYNTSSQYYKTNNDTHTYLYNALGKNHKLTNYQPTIGQQCDILSSSTTQKYLGWQRCTITNITKENYQFKYHSNAQHTTKKQQQVIFAEYGSRTQDQQWRTNIGIGQLVDCYLNKIWYKATVIEIQEVDLQGRKAKIGYRRPNQNGTLIDTLGNKFCGLSQKQDQWINIFSIRIQTNGKMTSNKSSDNYIILGTQQNLIDDLYDLLFQQQYKGKQFYAIARPPVNKSVSLLLFINTFVENKGIEKVIEIMENTDISDEIVFNLIGIINIIVPYFPKMFLTNPILSQLHTKIAEYLKSSLKSLGLQKIQNLLLCYDILGKRLFPLPQIQHSSKSLKTILIKQFLKLNLQKQMFGLRYLNQLIQPKIIYSPMYKYQLNNFLQEEKIYQLIYHSNKHEQIISRTSNLLQYMVENQIISERQFDTLWLIIPLNDQRGRTIIQKLFVQCSKKLPITYIELLIQKILSLQVTQLTINNLNLLKQLATRTINSQYSIKIITYLWNALTIKSNNIKNNIQDTVEKVFKSLISSLQNPKIKMWVLQLMSQKLHQYKKIKNYITLLHDFIKLYPQSYQISPTQIIEQNNQLIPKTKHQAVSFIKSKQMYNSILDLLFQSKDQNINKDILNFMNFLFQYDQEDINGIIRDVFSKVKISINFLDWVDRLLPRSLPFVTELLEQTTEISMFENINAYNFKSIKSLITNINIRQQNMKIIIKQYPKNFISNAMQLSLMHYHMCMEQSFFYAPSFDEKAHGILNMMEQQKKYIYLLVSPSKIIGRKLLWNLLTIVKQKSVCNAIIQLIVSFVANLDQSIQDKTQQYRRQFLEDIIQQIKLLTQQNQYSQQIKYKLQIYIKLIYQIFEQTQKLGLGNLSPHFEKIQGQKLVLNLQNIVHQQRRYKFTVNCNENYTYWRLKKIVGKIIGEKPENIYVLSMMDRRCDAANGKNISHLVHQREGLKVILKPIQLILLSTILNKNQTALLPQIQLIFHRIFDHYKNPQTNTLSNKQLATLSKIQWDDQLLKDKGGLLKIWEQQDRQQKGYLTFQQFITIMFDNHADVLKMINRNQQKNNKWTKLLEQEQTPLDQSKLPRKILSNPEVFHLIFSILSNDTFQQLHLNFYKLLTQLEQDQSIVTEVQNKIYNLIQTQNSIYNLCYSLQIANSQLSKRQQFFLNFWSNNGINLLLQKIKSLFINNPTIYSLDALMKNSILPGCFKIINMYIIELKYQYQIVKFLNEHMFYFMDFDEFVKKYNENKLLLNETDPHAKQNCQKLMQQTNIQQLFNQIYELSVYLHMNIMNNYATTTPTQNLSKLTTQIFRVIASLISTDTTHNYTFNPMDFLFGVMHQFYLCRKFTSIFLYIYISNIQVEHLSQLENILVELIKQLPIKNKMENYAYFSILNKIIQRYLCINNGDHANNQFIVNFGNTLLDRLFNQVPSQNRNVDIFMSFSDKIINSILSIIQTIINDDKICQMFSPRKIQLLQKCLFAYNIQTKLQNLQITQQMLITKAQPQHFKNYVMCKSSSTRNLAYKIVARLHQMSSNQHPQFIDKYILPIIDSISKEVRLSGSKSYDVGLKNLGYTCYMNSMLQVLNEVKPFRNSLMKCQSTAPLVIQLQKLFAALFFSQKIDYIPETLLKAFSPPINPFIQQDTTEFLNFLFDQLQSILKSTKYRYLLDEIFQGLNTVQMICHSCKQKKQNIEPFFSFGVEIQNKSDLLLALEGTYQGEIISDYLCDFCHQKVDMTKRNLLSQIPSIMFIHLKRMVFNYDVFTNMKIHSKLTFPQILNIQPYTKQGVELREKLGLEYIKNLSNNQQQQKIFEQLTLHDRQKDFYKLKLKGIIVHSGSADVGHYYCILLKQQKQKQVTTWRKYDDSKVSSFMKSSFETQCYGGNVNCQTWDSVTSVNAYVLVYEKIIKNPIKIITQNQDMREQQLVPYQCVPIYNSPNTYRQIWMDNHNFMVESHLLSSTFANDFMNFMCKIINLAPSSINKIQMVSYLVFKICIYSGVVGDLAKIIIANTDLITPQHFSQYITGDRALLSKLMFHSEKALREFMATYLHVIIIESYKKGQESDKQKILIYINELINSMTTQAAKNWNKIDGYFKLLSLLVNSSIQIPQFWLIFRQHNLISSLIDFSMQKQSPVKINQKNYSLGTKSNPMDFTYALSIIRIMLKHSYGFNGKNYQIPSIPQYLLYHLNNNDIICLSHIQFYKKMLRERQNYHDLALIIQTLCIMNIQFSKAIIQAILQTKTILDKKQEKRDQKNQLSVICLEILRIRDDFWLHRAEYLLGVTLPLVIGDNLIGVLDENRYFVSSALPEMNQTETIFAFPYNNRKKKRMQCFQVIKAIVEGCSVSDIAMTYLCRQPSLCYIFTSFLQWIQYFFSRFMVLNQIQIKSKQYIQLGIENSYQCVNKIKQFMLNHPEINPYQPILSGLITETKQLQNQQILQKNGVEVKVYQCTVFCAKSSPTFGANAIVAKYLLENNQLKKNVSNNSNILNFFKKQIKLTSTKPQKQQISAPSSKMQQQKSKISKKQQTEKQKIKQQLQNKQKNTLPTEEMNLQQVFQCNYFRKIKITNTSKKTKIVKMIINTDKYPNFIIPQQFNLKLTTNSSQTICLAKQNYEQDWGKCDIKISVEQYLKEKHEKKNTWWFKNYEQEKKLQQPTNQMTMEPQKKQQQIEIPIKNQIMNFIECKTCTLMNQPTNMFCEACENQLY